VVRRTRYYVYADGGVWRVPYNRDGTHPLETGETLNLRRCSQLASDLNYRTGRWSRLPVGVYQEDDGTRLYSGSDGVEVFSLYDYDIPYD